VLESLLFGIVWNYFKEHIIFDEGNEVEEFEQISQLAGTVHSALEYLQSIYRNPAEPEARRMRAAVECLPFENPKLSAIGVASLTGRDFAAALDRAISRSRPVLIEATAVEPRQGE
jgi:hypothetical protein